MRTTRSLRFDGLKNARSSMGYLFGIMVLAALLVFPLRAETDAGPVLRPETFKLTESDRTYWAFQTVKRPRVPTVRSTELISNPVDSFVLAQLEEKGVMVNPRATPRELVRRAHFDLLGLPPTPETVKAFEQEPSDAAWEQLIDRLLASPHYGERWGRHWLDLVRYAESNGYERDGPKPNAWRYRDYVINAFNGDKPYDRFILEQLAGDELAEELADSQPAGPWRDLLIATGFYRLHVWDDEPDSTISAEYDDLDDVMVTTGTAFLGLTLGCARCHDHKFDPISQADYYSMLGFIRSIDPYGQHKTGGGGRGTGKIERALVPASELKVWESEKQKQIENYQQLLAKTTDDNAKKELTAALKQAQGAKPPFDFALAVAENGPQPVVTRLLSRGEAHSPKGEVSPAFLSVLGLPAPRFPERPASAASTGRRRVLAEWIANPQNPLTARVMVNRLWQHHFGAGIVSTPDDFGQTGLRPSNQPLLDYLAAEFIEGGWSLKRMHKLIMTSSTYRLSSQKPPLATGHADEENTLFWRQNLRRADAEVIRDSILFVSGTLNTKRGGPSVYPTLPQDVHKTQDSAGKGWADSPPIEQSRRSVYLVVKRALKIPLLESFDFANSASPSGLRPVTTTAPQALMLLNDQFVQQQAAALAARVNHEAAGNPDARIERTFQLVLQRGPSPAELQAAQNLLSFQRHRASLDATADPEQFAWTSFSRALLNLNEVIYVD